jgi:hypothetical protein
MNIKLFFAILSLVPALFAYYYYFRDIFRGHTKPHAFSWLIWGTLATNGFIGQVQAHGGFGAWVTGLTAAASLTVFCLALFKGDNKRSTTDWTLLCLAAIGFLLLFVINNKTIALWITLVTLTAGFAMTIVKALKRPQEETAKAFILNALKFIPSIAALGSFSFLTVAYPLVALIGNAAIAFAIYIGKRSQKEGTTIVKS